MRCFNRRLLFFLVIASSLALSTSRVEAQQVSVPITWHRQEHSLSCEIAALKMALGSHDINVSEQALQARLPFDRTVKQPGVWGDPYQGFVGDINGRMLRTGYGVYWEPIAKVGNRHVHTKTLENSSPAEVARFVANGDPVVVWGYYGSPTIHSWRTPAGKKIDAVNGEHARVVYGFDGPPTAPTHFYLMDPLAGRLRWSTAQFLANWGSFNYSGVVVTHHPRWAQVPGESKVWEINKDGKTRRWVKTWAELVAHGGGADSITPLSAAALNKYTVAP